MKAYKNCSFCRLMRSLAFAGVGMGVGSGTAYLLGAEKQTMMLSGIVVAAILVFGLVDNKKRRS
jgi:hypothetical protein